MRIRTLLTGTFAALLVAGAAYAADPKTLTIWINGDKGYNGLQKVGDAFGKKAGVKVIVEHPEDAPGKFQQAASEGKGPDIWIWAHDRVGEWVSSGLLSEVHPSKKTRDSIDPMAWKAFTITGKTWGYPISIEAVALIYNKALVPNPPKTFEEIFALDKKLNAKNKDTHAILWDYNNTYFTWPLLAANGGYAFKQRPDGTYDGKDTGVNTPGALKGAQMLNRLIKEDVMPSGSGYADMEAAMAEGKLGMMISGPWAWENVQKAKINYGVARIPSVGGKKAVPFVGVVGAMIPKASRNAKLAQTFIEEFMLVPSGLKMINDDVPLGTPANKAFYDQLKSDPRIQATMASAKDGVIMPNNPEMGRFWAAMLSSLGAISEGRQTPEQALAAAEKRIKAK